MADYADPIEIDEIEKIYANFPPVSEIVDMCIALGIKRDYARTRNDLDDVWAYYHELEAMMEAKRLINPDSGIMRAGSISWMKSTAYQ